ncbi:MAG: cadherin-like beta sandwich domain-containing protein [Clostridia bacterium]|nr:cadherin-like beta sandwich domain-containing protein [Clostridia bacterium]
MKSGYNEVKVIVTSENGKEKTYTLNVYREDLSSLLLRELSVTDNVTNYELSPEFDRLTMEYTVKVDSTVSKVTVNAIAEEEKETVLIQGTGDYNLQTGKNVVEVKVIATDGREETYTINIYRGKNSNCNLESIQVFDTKSNEYPLTTDFEKERLEYISMYQTNCDKVNIIAKPEVSTTTVKLLDGEDVKARK